MYSLAIANDDPERYQLISDINGVILPRATESEVREYIRAVAIARADASVTQLVEQLLARQQVHH